jgi:hypothetical protein
MVGCGSCADERKIQEVLIERACYDASVGGAP